jgi:hypothetical protein
MIDTSATTRDIRPGVYLKAVHKSNGTIQESQGVVLAVRNGVAQVPMTRGGKTVPDHIVLGKIISAQVGVYPLR